MVVKMWRHYPLDSAIIEILEKKGAITDLKLFDLLKEKREEVGFGDLNKTLMKMEVEGLAFVSSLAKGRRRVESLKRKSN